MYTIIDAPGYHGDIVRVYATTDSESVARNYDRSKSLMVITGCHHATGSRIPWGAMQAMLNSGAWVVVRFED